MLTYRRLTRICDSTYIVFACVCVIIVYRHTENAHMDTFGANS